MLFTKILSGIFSLVLISACSHQNPHANTQPNLALNKIAADASVAPLTTQTANPKPNAAPPTRSASDPKTTPTFVASAPDLGKVEPVKQMQVRLWLNFQNPDKLQALADAVIDEASPQYQKWLSLDAFKTKFAPSSEAIQKIRAYLTSENLSVVAVGPGNTWISANGTADNIQKALSVRIHNFLVDGKVIHANVSDPSLPGDLGNLVAWVGGLTNLPTVAPSANAAQKSAAPANLHTGSYTNQCFHGAETHNFASADGKTTATYSGTRFVGDPTDEDAIALSTCGYDPATLQKDNVKKAASPHGNHC